MTIPPSVTSIGYQVFINCTSLTSLKVSSGSPGLSSIGGQAFYNSSSLVEAVFPGNAPAIGAQVFDLAAAGFTIYRPAEATGYDVAPWTNYASGTSTPDPLADWLTANNLPADANLLSDDNGDGVSILMAYALNLNPNLNLRAAMPQTVFSAGQMTLSYLEATEDVDYVVETSTDMLDWTTEGVTSVLNEVTRIRTVTVARTGTQRFMRFSVSR